MKKQWMAACVIAVAALCIVAGCSKKKTKLEVTPQPTPQEEPAPAPVHVPSDEDVFEPVDMDAKMMEIFATIYFDYDKWDLRPETIEVLEKIAALMSENTTVRVLVEGHADERGTNEYNIGLGENRAKAAKRYLTAYGIKDSRFEATSYGRERPAIPNCSDEPCHSKNRRVEWKILAK